MKMRLLLSWPVPRLPRAPLAPLPVLDRQLTSWPDCTDQPVCQNVRTLCVQSPAADAVESPEQVRTGELPDFSAVPGPGLGARRYARARVS
eukprot:COSAG02_NODE_60693_length_270_cov_1.187135_1_plen_90_part_11